MGFQRASLCGRPFEARVVLIFHLYSNSFVKARLEARHIKTMKKQMVWPKNDGLPIQIYCLIMGFQRDSLCGRPFEARVVLIFHLYSNSFVKARLEARDIKTLKNKCFDHKMTDSWASHSS